MDRRGFLSSLVTTVVASQLPPHATQTYGERLAHAARAQVSVTTSYDPRWVRLSYPSGSATVVHNIGNGAEETPLSAFRSHRAAGHYRWPANA